MFLVHKKNALKHELWLNSLCRFIRKKNYDCWGLSDQLKQILVYFFLFFEEEERTLAEVEVWVQGIRDGNLTWRYHDSTQLNYTCLTGVTAGPRDNYMRARSAGSYNCNDHNENYRSFFLCEIYIRDNRIWKDEDVYMYAVVLFIPPFRKRRGNTILPLCVFLCNQSFLFVCP